MGTYAAKSIDALGSARGYASCLLFSTGTPQQRAALDDALRQLDAAESEAQPAGLCLALAEVAVALIALGDAHSSQLMIGRALRWSALVARADLRADLLCTLAEACCLAAEQIEERLRQDESAGFDDINAIDNFDSFDNTTTDDAEDPADHERMVQGEYARARDCVDEAAALAGFATDPMYEVRLLLRVSAVLERCGDMGDAVQMQFRAMACLGLQAPDQDGLADTPAPGPLQLPPPPQLM